VWCFVETIDDQWKGLQREQKDIAKEEETGVREIRLKMIKGGCVVFRLDKNCGGDVDSSKPNTDSARLHDSMADPAAG
jgi:hypothetical protein